MIVDASALLAILRDEPDAAFFADALAGRAAARRISAANYLEAAIVIDAAKDPVASRRFDDLVAMAEMLVEPVTAAHAEVARAAYRDFGKGGGHPAQLNFGDCFAYALARTSGEPLLCKGDDFVHTDIAVQRPG
jgi:ribonuclease VapC